MSSFTLYVKFYLTKYTKYTCILEYRSIVKIKCGQNSSRQISSIQDTLDIIVIVMTQVDCYWIFWVGCMGNIWNSQGIRSALSHPETYGF